MPIKDPEKRKEAQQRATEKRQGQRARFWACVVYPDSAESGYTTHAQNLARCPCRFSVALCWASFRFSGSLIGILLPPYLHGWRPWVRVSHTAPPGGGVVVHPPPGCPIPRPDFSQPEADSKRAAPRGCSFAVCLGLRKIGPWNGATWGGVDYDPPPRGCRMADPNPGPPPVEIGR